MVITMCGVKLKDIKRPNDLILNETIVQLAIANSVHWYDHVLRRGWPCLEKRIRF